MTSGPHGFESQVKQLGDLLATWDHLPSILSARRSEIDQRFQDRQAKFRDDVGNLQRNAVQEAESCANVELTDGRSIRDVVKSIESIPFGRIAPTGIVVGQNSRTIIQTSPPARWNGKAFGPEVYVGGQVAFPVEVKDISGRPLWVSADSNPGRAELVAIIVDHFRRLFPGGEVHLVDCLTMGSDLPALEPWINFDLINSISVTSEEISERSAFLRELWNQNMAVIRHANLPLNQLSLPVGKSGIQFGLLVITAGIT